MIVYVLTNIESGWDCVSGVYADRDDALRHIGESEDFSDFSIDQLNSLYETGDTQFVIHEKVLKL